MSLPLPRHRQLLGTLRTGSLVTGLALLAGACGTETLASSTLDAAIIEPDAAPPPFEMAMFATAGNVYHFDVTQAQADAMDNRQGGGGCNFCADGFGNGDPYQIGGGGVADDRTYADAMRVSTVDGQAHDFGKMALWTIGQSSFRPWAGIPNLRVDADKFEPGLDVGGVENFRFNNGQVGGIYREAIALRLWDALGYPTPETTFAWVEAPTQWGENRVPFTLAEVYKRSWCDREIPGGCVNMWEGVGEPQYFPNDASTCQVDECDNSRLEEFGAQVNSTPQGPGFADALASFIDWDMFHSFQCLSWITGTGDDYIHNNNNLLVVERDDGRLQFHPYSTDISANQDWYQDVKLLGGSQLARGCQTDPACWQDTLTRCTELLDAYDALDVNATIVQPVLDEVERNGMMRAGDDERAAFLLDWYSSRADKLRTDPAWNIVPCAGPDVCADRDDGRTSCINETCREPLQACDENFQCPENFYCNQGGDDLCYPFNW